MYPVVMTNIAMENDPFIDDFPMKTSIYTGFSMAMLNNQMVFELYVYDCVSLSKHMIRHDNTIYISFTYAVGGMPHMHLLCICVI